MLHIFTAGLISSDLILNARVGARTVGLTLPEIIQSYSTNFGIEKKNAVIHYL